MVVLRYRLVGGSVLALACLVGSDAFTARTSPAVRPAPSSAPSTTRLRDVTSVPRDDGSGLSYAERSRPYRRDVFAYDDWVRHRSSARFSGRLGKLTKSGIVRALFDEIVLTSSVAAFICAFNALLVAGFDDLGGNHYGPLLGNALHLPALSLPAQFFTLSSPALSLLLGTYSQLGLLWAVPCLCRIPFFSRTSLTVFLAVFKTNTSYQRWDEARKNWGT